jgi:hypothetical protein
MSSSQLVVLRENRDAGGLAAQGRLPVRFNVASRANVQ